MDNASPLDTIARAVTTCLSNARTAAVASQPKYAASAEQPNQGFVSRVLVLYLDLQVEKMERSDRGRTGDVQLSSEIYFQLLSLLEGQYSLNRHFKLS
jgi:hypothetical protein